MADFIAAIGLVLVIEGLVYAAFPAGAKRALSMLFETPDAQLRASGVIAAVLGVLIVWAVRAKGFACDAVRTEFKEPAVQNRVQLRV